MSKQDTKKYVLFMSGHTNGHTLHLLDVRATKECVSSVPKSN